MWVVVPTIFYFAYTIGMRDLLKDDTNKYNVLLASFAVTASLAGLCGMRISSRVDSETHKARVRFFQSSVLMMQALILMYGIDWLIGPEEPSGWLKKLLLSAGTSLYRLMIFIATIQWLLAFELVNTALWRYHYRAPDVPPRFPETPQSEESKNDN